MTSTDFTFPQPTDDELAAQQPWESRSLASASTTLHHGDRAHLSSSADAQQPQAASARSARIGTVALWMAIIAGGLSLLASIALGATVGPVEAQSGYYFTDTPDWYRNAAIGLVGLQALCTGLGIAGLITGIVAIATDRGRVQGIIASATAALAPFVSFGVFITLSLTLA